MEENMKKQAFWTMVCLIGVTCLTYAQQGVQVRLFDRPELPSFEKAQFLVLFQGDLNGEINPCG